MGALGAASLLASGCRCDAEVEGKATSQNASDEQAEETLKKDKEPAAQPPKGSPLPEGPRLVAVPGKGLSAIRFGATRETIERHMNAPCDIVEEDRCVYVDRAVEFFLEDDELVRIKAHRRDRAVEGTKEKHFGTFRGILPQTIMMGLHRHVVLEEYGKPEKKEPVDPPGPNGIVDRHFYDGIILEYDLLDNGNTVLSAMEIFPSETTEEVVLPPEPKK